MREAPFLAQKKQAGREGSRGWGLRAPSRNSVTPPNSQRERERLPESHELAKGPEAGAMAVLPAALSMQPRETLGRGLGDFLALETIK